MIGKLKWDSDFFNLKVGKIDVGDFEIEKFNKEKTEFDLIYIFATPTNTTLNHQLNNLGAILTDQKITFSKELTSANPNIIKDEIQEIKNTERVSGLINLAIQSGEYSRFKIDQKIGKERFEKLYATWIENSLNGKIADRVIIYGNPTMPKGVITLKSHNDYGQIGIIAVDEKYRAQAIGSKLISYSENYFFSRGIRKLKVVSQLANKQACGFYKKNNFEIEDVVNVYHYWNKHE